LSDEDLSNKLSEKIGRFLNQQRLLALGIMLLGLILYVQSPPTNTFTQNLLPILVVVIGTILFWRSGETDG
jgi:hypothetical protein